MTPTDAERVLVYIEGAFSKWLPTDIQRQIWLDAIAGANCHPQQIIRAVDTHRREREFHDPVWKAVEDILSATGYSDTPAGVLETMAKIESFFPNWKITAEIRSAWIRALSRDRIDLKKIMRAVEEHWKTPDKSGRQRFEPVLKSVMMIAGYASDQVNVSAFNADEAAEKARHDQEYRHVSCLARNWIAGASDDDLDAIRQRVIDRERLNGRDAFADYLLSRWKVVKPTEDDVRELFHAIRDPKAPPNAYKKYQHAQAVFDGTAEDTGLGAAWTMAIGSQLEYETEREAAFKGERR